MSAGRHVCFICGKDKPDDPLEKGICAECWEQARLRQKQEDAL